MTTPSWRSQAQDVFRGTADLALLPKLLSRARSLNVPAHEPWKSVVFDWMEVFHYHRHELGPDLPVATLKALLDAGLDPHGGRPSFSHLGSASKSREHILSHYRILKEKPSFSQTAFRYSLAGPFRKQPEKQHGTNWMGKVIWVAREHPRLVSMVDLFLQAGVHPHDQGPHRFIDGPYSAQGFDGPQEEDEDDSIQARVTAPWSAWPTALLAGRQDVLERLAAVAGDVPPPDWVPAVAAVLRNGVGNQGDWRKAREVLLWFTQRYPPTPEDCEAVLSTLWHKGRVQNDDGLALWLSLPVAGLANRERPVGAPSSFNPWACLGFPDANAVFAHEQVLSVLRRHPKWGRPEAVLSCPAAARRLYDESKNPGSLLTAWVEDCSRIGADDSVLLHRQRLFEALDRMQGLSDPALPAFVARLRRPPDAPSSDWLSRHAPAWFDPGSNGPTPWHYGPTPRIQRWLKSMGSQPWGVDEQGRSGLARGLVALLRREDTAALEELLPWLSHSAVDWEERVEGRTLKQWVRGCSFLAKAAPGPKRFVDLESLLVAVETGDLASVAAQLAHRKSAGLPGLNEEESCRVVEASLSFVPSYATGQASLMNNEDFERRERIYNEVWPWIFKSPCRSSMPHAGQWLSRSWSSAQLRNDPRPDMSRLWECYDVTQPWSRRDLKSLADWAGQDITLAVVYSSPSVGPWTSPAWAVVTPEHKAALARTVLSTVVHARNPFRVHADFNVGWMEMFLKAFADVHDIHEGASPSRIRKTLDLLEGPVSTTHQEQRHATPPVVSSWIAAGKARLMEARLTAPAAPLLKRRF